MPPPALLQNKLISIWSYFLVLKHGHEEKGHIFCDGFDRPDFAPAHLLLVLLPDFKTIIAG